MVQDGQLLAVFNSAHRVMKAENILKKAGFTILLIAAPRALSTDCGLAIRYDNTLFDSVLETLSSANLLPMSIVRKESDSNYALIWSDEIREQ
jgi:hypothetical protein